MLSHVFVALVALSGFAVARWPIDDGDYYIQLHWKEDGKARTSYAQPSDDAIWMSSTNHPGANQTWHVAFTHGGYTIQNVGNKALVRSPGKKGDSIILTKDQAPSLWRFDPVDAKQTAFVITDPENRLVWTAEQTEEDMVILDKNTKTPNLQFWYLKPAFPRA